MIHVCNTDLGYLSEGQNKVTGSISDLRLPNGLFVSFAFEVVVTIDGLDHENGQVHYFDISVYDSNGSSILFDRTYMTSMEMAVWTALDVDLGLCPV